MKIELTLFWIDSFVPSELWFSGPYNSFETATSITSIAALEMSCHENDLFKPPPRVLKLTDTLKSLITLGRHEQTKKHFVSTTGIKIKYINNIPDLLIYVQFRVLFPRPCIVNMLFVIDNENRNLTFPNHIMCLLLFLTKQGEIRHLYPILVSKE